MFNFLKWFKRKRPRTLAELDSLNLGDILKLLNEPSLTEIHEILSSPAVCKCRLCSGDLVPVVPETKLGEKILKECSLCHERCYV